MISSALASTSHGPTSLRSRAWQQPPETPVPDVMANNSLWSLFLLVILVAFQIWAIVQVRHQRSLPHSVSLYLRAVALNRGMREPSSLPSGREHERQEMPLRG
jgi:hypothetical protein